MLIVTISIIGFSIFGIITIPLIDAYARFLGWFYSIFGGIVMSWMGSEAWLHAKQKSILSNLIPQQQTYNKKLLSE